MKCYRHPDSDAIAICRQCGRAVCSDCPLENEREKVLCSTACNLAAKRDAIVQKLIAQNALVSLRSLKGATLMLKLLGSLCILAAVGSLVIPFLLKNRIPHLDDVGFSIIIGGCGVSCFLGNRWAFPRSLKLDQEIAKLEWVTKEEDPQHLPPNKI